MSGGVDTSRHGLPAYYHEPIESTALGLAIQGLVRAMNLPRGPGAVVSLKGIDWHRLGLGGEIGFIAR